jgi:2-methylcitrate dehydratase
VPTYARQEESIIETQREAQRTAARSEDRIQAFLTRYAIDLRYRDLRAETVHAAKVRIIDTLGALIAGFDGPPCRVARQLAADMQQSNGATLLGTRTKTSLDMAAFVNATAARFPELTDTYHWPGSAYGHPSDVVAPLLSVAEFARADGRALLTAVVLAYEVFCRFSDIFHNRAFDPANFGCVAMAAGAGKLLGLTAEAMSNGIAMAVTANVILRQVRVDHLTMFKVAAAGQAARAGVFAALLARTGMEGPHLPFEGRAGWCTYVAGESLSFGAFGGKDEPFKILATRLKIRPCAGNTISSVLAAEKIALHAPVERVERVCVEVYKAAKTASGTGAHFWNPQSAETADHSIPYLVAVALLDGIVTPHSYDDAHLCNDRVRALMRKIEVIENEDFTRDYEQVPQVHRTRVTVTLRDGSKQVGEAGGDEDDLGAPKSDAQVEAKFRNLTREALGADRADAVLARLWQLEQVNDTAELPPLFVLGSGGGL